MQASVPSKPSDSNVQYCEGSTALHMAIDNGQHNKSWCVQALVDNGAALDARDVHGRTPLHIASMRGYHHVIKTTSSFSRVFPLQMIIMAVHLYTMPARILTLNL